MQMLGAATRFARMEHYTEARSRYVIVVRCSGELIGVSTVFVATTVFPIGYLLSCGDVEPNPKPGGGSGDSREFSSGAANSSVPAQSNQASLDRLHADMAHTLNQVVLRMEQTNSKGERSKYSLEVWKTRSTVDCTN